MIYNKLGRGVTVYNGPTYFGKRGIKEDNDIIFYRDYSVCSEQPTTN